jgi:hypothetical protein
MERPEKKVREEENARLKFSGLLRRDLAPDSKKLTVSARNLHWLQQGAAGDESGKIWRLRSAASVAAKESHQGDDQQADHPTGGGPNGGNFRCQ